jgi:hypothetical protein
MARHTTVLEEATTPNITTVMARMAATAALRPSSSSVTTFPLCRLVWLRKRLCMVCSRVRRLGSSLEAGTEVMIAAEEVEATIRDQDRTSVVVMDRAVTDVEGVDMASKVEMVTASKVAMATAMEVATEETEVVTLEVVMAEDVAEVEEGDIRSECER